MPSARPSDFRGSGGILRNQDATIVGLEFTPDNPLAGKGTPKPGQKKSDFKSLWAVLKVRVDGADPSLPPSLQPVWVGGADDFGITDDKMGLTGEQELSKSSGWWILLDSMVNPGGVKASGFDEENFPNDDPTTADYSALVGARFKFNWQVNAKATAKYGKKVSKTDAKKTFDREDLITTAYYGQVDVDEADNAPAAQTTTGKGSSAPPAKGNKKGSKVDVAKEAKDAIVIALSTAKDKTLSKSKLAVKLLTQLATVDAELRTAIREFADINDNLRNIDGVTFDEKTSSVKLDE